MKTSSTEKHSDESHSGRGRSYRPGAGAAARAFEERAGVKAPRIIAWEITRSCNLACAHCRAAAHCEPYEGELSLDECKRVIDDIASITDPILILTGGEPLMRADIWDIIDYARDKGLHPVIIVEYERTPFIAKEGNTRVTFDRNIRSSSELDALLADRELMSRPVMEKGQNLLEVKFDAFLPDHIGHAIETGHMRRETFSKYYLTRKYAFSAASRYTVSGGLIQGGKYEHIFQHL